MTHSDPTSLSAAGLPWSDAQLVGYRWTHDGRDLWLDVEFGSGTVGVLKYTWAGGFDISIEYQPRRSGSTMACGVYFTEVEG